MRQLGIIIAAFAFSTAPALATEVTVPSGHALSLFDVIVEPPMGRFRFTLPAIAQGVEFADLVDDFDYLCTEIASPALQQAGVEVTAVIISVSAAEVPFGEASEVVQYFQPYRLDGETCVWEEF